MREMGGYLPLELESGKEYFNWVPAKWMGKYGSGRSALYAAILSLHAKVLWVPFFYCPTTLLMLESLPITIKRYYITEDLLPNDERDSENETLLLVNYYGIMDEKIHSFVKGRNNIIIDNTQAFFCSPVLRDGILNIYSCRKFIGVSDGSYLIGPGQVWPELEQKKSYKSALFLLKSLECGTNSAYCESKENEERLGHGFSMMSEMTRLLLDSVSYVRIRERREQNFGYLHYRFKGIQRLDIGDGKMAAYCYPLLLDEDVRGALIRKKVYIPTLWKELITEEFQGTREYRLAKNMLCLPVDQRYGWEDMEYLSSLIERIRG